MSDDRSAFDVDSSVVQLGVVGPRFGWTLSLCVAAREAGGCFQRLDHRARQRSPGGAAADPERAAASAAQRARRKTRQYCAANRLNRLGTLTYAGAGCHDPRQLRADVAAFFRELRRLLGGKPFAYLWTAEWHKSGHGLHVHFAVGRFIQRSRIEQAWGHGFVHIKLLGDLPVGSGAVAEARRAASYLSKYVGKDFDADRMPGLHRYEVAQGFQPVMTAISGRSETDVLAKASAIMGRRPDVYWSSVGVNGWDRPQAVWVQWPG